jgi:hypothetical protein
MERIGGWVEAEEDKSTENHFKVKTLKQLNIGALVLSSFFIRCSNALTFRRIF